MQMKTTLGALTAFLLIIGVVLAWPAQNGLADTLRSNNYQFQESSLGGSSLLNASSANFQAASSTGILGLGNSASTNVQINAGHQTTDSPTLSFSVDSANVNFGSFSAAQAATASSTFSVINYTSYGYVVQMLGTPPTNGTHAITPMGTDALGGPQASQAGVEQFGINLVANTSPVSIGANPDHGPINPDGSQFGVGEATDNYDNPNNYRFVSGETIASAPKSSGKTVYTISYIVNVGNLTPGGQYTGHQTIVCTGTY